MLPTFKKVAVAASISGLSVMAYAANDVIGQNDAYSFSTLTQSTGVSVGDPNDGFFGSFDNTFSFVAGSSSGVIAKWSGIDGVGDLLIQYRVGVGSTPAWGAWSTLSGVQEDPDSGAFSLSKLSGALTAGQTYSFELKGTASQATYTVTLAPVPEPETWAMLLSGIGLLGAVARRRRSAVLGA